jgi:small GTP-binding protein
MANTGKTSIIRQYIDGVFSPGNFPTVLPLADSVPFCDDFGPFELAIWDTAGADEWISMNTATFRQLHAVIFVASYDLSESLKEAVTKWLPILSEHAALERCVKVLAMNKVDIADAGEDEVEEALIQQTKRDLGAHMFGVSAKLNRNVKEMFEFVAEAVRKRDCEGEGVREERQNRCRC